jgi:CII-binding regulator of phage lambda lysogenization HflD
VESCPAPESMESKYAGDLKATTKETVAGLEQLTQQLSQSLLPGEKTLNKTELKVLLGQIQSALSSITNSIPFIEQQFNEEREVQRDKMVGEMEAIATHIIHNVGLQAIAAKSLPQLMQPGLPQLAEGKKEK